MWVSWFSLSLLNDIEVEYSAKKADQKWSAFCYAYVLVDTI